jgi:hypothetical protein
MDARINYLINQIQFGFTDNQLGMPAYLYDIAREIRIIIAQLEVWAKAAEEKADEWQNLINEY